MLKLFRIMIQNEMKALKHSSRQVDVSTSILLRGGKGEPLEKFGSKTSYREQSWDCKGSGMCNCLLVFKIMISRFIYCFVSF